MKNKISKAQMGGSYASRRAYKGAGQSSSKKTSTESKPSGLGVAESLKQRKAIDDNKAKLAKSEEARKKMQGSAEQKSYEEAMRKDSEQRMAKRKASVKAKTVPVTKSINRTKENVDAVKTPTRPGLGMPEISKPSIQKQAQGRQYSEKEKQIMAVMEKGRKKDGTMKASAQRKIQRIRKGK